MFKTLRVTFSVIGLLLWVGCGGSLDVEETEYKQRMRDFVIGISQYSKSINPDFLILPQNGIELVSTNAQENGPPHMDYLNAIDGNGQEDLFFGYNRDNKRTPEDVNSYLKNYLDISKNTGNIILVTDYCSSESKMEESYSENKNLGYVSFAASHRDLDIIPDFPNPIHEESTLSINSINQIKNFLYLIDPSQFADKSEFINTTKSTNYDLLIMDLFFDEDLEFTVSEINQLKSKANGAERLLICYLSIGEAEDYRYYWEEDWNTSKPSWLEKENPNWEGNYKVEYWNSDWQNIIFGNDSSYLKKIIDAGFDGVYLDIIDAFEYFE